MYICFFGYANIIDFPLSPCSIEDKFLLQIYAIDRCLDCVETVEYVLTRCPVAVEVWEKKLDFYMELPDFNSLIFHAWLRKGCDMKSFSHKTNIPWATLFPYVCWTLWNARNQSIFETSKQNLLMLLSKPLLM